MAMTPEQIQARIEKKEKDIEKIQRRITKWSSGLRPEDIEVCKPYGEPDAAYGCPNYEAARTAYSNYVRSHTDIPTSDDWNKGPNIGELASAYRDLADARKTLLNYQSALAKINEFDSEEKIPAIWEFLTDWEAKCKEWYIRNADKYFNLMKTWYDDELDFKNEYKISHPAPDSHLDYRAYRLWERQMNVALDDYERRTFAGIDNFTKTITLIKKEYVETPEDRGGQRMYSSDYPFEYGAYRPVSYRVDEETLVRALADEKKRKYQELVKQVIAKIGAITDASGLSISPKGEIDGIIIGEGGKCKVETFSAGGWNIQRFHYRTRVDKLK